MKVCVFQCPNGTFESSLYPFGCGLADASSWCRSGLVQEDQPVRLKPHHRWRVKVHSSRACSMSGRSCSLARRVSFEAIAYAMSQRESEAGSAFSQVAAASSRQLQHGDVGLLGDLLQKKRPMRSSLAWRAHRCAWGQSFPAHERPSPSDDKGNRHPKSRPARERPHHIAQRAPQQPPPTPHPPPLFPHDSIEDIVAPRQHDDPDI